MLDIILRWAIPFLCGGAVTFAGTLLIRLRAIRNGMQCLLRAEIIREHDKHTERGFCPIYAKEALTRAYKAYHDVRGNDVATHLYEETIALPETVNKKEKTS